MHGPFLRLHMRSKRIPVSVHHPLRSPSLETSGCSGVRGSRHLPARCCVTLHTAHHAHDAGAAAERGRREGPQWLRWSRHVVRPVAEALCGERRVVRGAQAVSPARVVRGVAAFMWDVHRPPPARRQAVRTCTAVVSSHAVWRQQHGASSDRAPA